MAGPLNVMGMAKVLTGWTGTLSVTVGATTVAITPPMRTSAIILADRVVLIADALGVAVTTFATAAGVLTWSASATMSINATGVLRTRLNLAATTTGTDLAGVGAHTDGFYPEHGMEIATMPNTSTMVTPAASGSNPPIPNMAPQSLTIGVFGTLANLWTYEDAFGGDHVWDVWRAGRYWGRLRVNDVSRQPLGASREHGRIEMRGESYLWQVPA